jgi:hypothetical protein
MAALLRAASHWSADNWSQNMVAAGLSEKAILDELNPLCCQFDLLEYDAGNIARGSCQACHVPCQVAAHRGQIELGEIMVRTASRSRVAASLVLPTSSHD